MHGSTPRGVCSVPAACTATARYYTSRRNGQGWRKDKLSKAKRGSFLFLENRTHPQINHTLGSRHPADGTSLDSSRAYALLLTSRRGSAITSLRNSSHVGSQVEAFLFEGASQGKVTNACAYGNEQVCKKKKRGDKYWCDWLVHDAE